MKVLNSFFWPIVCVNNNLKYKWTHRSHIWINKRKFMSDWHFYTTCTCCAVNRDHLIQQTIKITSWTILPNAHLYNSRNYRKALHMVDILKSIQHWPYWSYLTSNVSLLHTVLVPVLFFPIPTVYKDYTLNKTCSIFLHNLLYYHQIFSVLYYT